MGKNEIIENIYPTSMRKLLLSKRKKKELSHGSEAAFEIGIEI